MADLAQTPPAPKPLLMTFGSLLCTYVILISAGFAMLRSPLATVRGNELSIDRALFTVINAVTLTGFEQSIGLGELRVAGQITVFVLILAGLGLTLVIGGTLLTRIVRLPYSDQQVFTATAIAVAIAAALGAIGLSVDGGSVWFGIFGGVSALGNCGMHLGELSPAGSVPTQLVSLPLAIAGGLSVPVLLAIGDALLKRKPLSPHALAVLSMSSLFYIGGFVLLAITQSTGRARVDPHMLVICSTEALNSRTCGMAFAPLDTLTRASQWVLMLLMMIGAAPAGSGGGLKVTTPLVLLRGVRRSWEGKNVGQPFAVAATWCGVYGVLVFTGLLSLLASEPQIPADRLLLLTISAASNVGLAHNPVSIVGPGLFTLGAIALLGRLLPFAVLYWMASNVREADVAVG